MGMKLLIALARPVLIVFQLVVPMLPDESSMNPSWMMSAFAGPAAPIESATLAAAAANLKRLIMPSSSPSHLHSAVDNRVAADKADVVPLRAIPLDSMIDPGLLSSQPPCM